MPSVKAALLATALLFFVAACGSKGAKVLNEADWAGRMCKISQDYKDATLKAGAANQVDRTKLASGQQSKDKVIALDKQVETAATNAAKQLQALKPPSSVQSFHDSLVTEFVGLAGALRRDQASLTSAQNEADFTAANTTLSAFLSDAEKTAMAEYLKLEAGPLLAVRNNAKCGDVPVNNNG